jgi:hypothetical protein
MFLGLLCVEERIINAYRQCVAFCVCAALRSFLDALALPLVPLVSFELQKPLVPEPVELWFLNRQIRPST